MRLVTPCLLLCLVLEGGSKESRRRRKEQDPSPASPAQGGHGCQFPDDMRGSWFLGGSRKDFVIKKKQFGLGAWCYRLQDEQSLLYTVMKRPEKCFQCLQIWRRHENVVQFRIGACVKNIDQLDCQFPENLPMETLLRLHDTPDTPCPFKGSFNFTYKEEGRECGAPVSRISRCMAPSQALFNFEICPDDVKEEAGDSVFYNTIIGLDGDSQETLTCRATWTSDLNDKETFMMGTLDYRYKRTDEERVRCFLVQETKRGIQVAQSSDGTCYNNLASSQSGHRTLKLDKVEDNTEGEEESCVFPAWARDMGPLISFSFSSRYEIVEEGRVLSLSNYSAVSQRSHEMSRTQCLRVVEESDNEEAGYVKMVTRVTAGCQHMYKCLRVFRRTENIIEIQEGSPTIYKLAACSPQNFDERLMIYTTLFKESLEPQPCPINGVHNVTELDLDGQADVCAFSGFTNIDIRCKEESTVEFFKQCPSKRPEDMKQMKTTSSASYNCLGGWSETLPLSSLPHPNLYLMNQFLGLGSIGAGRKTIYTVDRDQEGEGEQARDRRNVTIGYVVAQRGQGARAGDQKRICFIYMKAEGQDSWGSQYSWTVDKTACLRNIRPGFGARQRFNTTILETCGAATSEIYFRTFLSIFFVQAIFLLSPFL